MGGGGQGAGAQSRQQVDPLRGGLEAATGLREKVAARAEIIRIPNNSTRF